MTAASSLAALEVAAERVVLYTDLANLTSNSACQSVGYAPVFDAKERTFA